MEWFVARNGKPVGPLTFDALVDAARRGQLNQEDYVWQPGADTWERADSQRAHANGADHQAAEHKLRALGSLINRRQPVRKQERGIAAPVIGRARNRMVVVSKRVSKHPKNGVNDTCPAGSR